MKNTFLFKGTLRKLVIFLTASVCFFLSSNAQQYTYTTESFEGSSWSSASFGSSGGSNVSSTTGQWFVAKATLRSDSPNAYDGTKSLESAGSQFQLITPILNEGAKQLTFYGFGNSAKPVTISTSTDGTTYTDITTTANFSSSWKLYTIDINGSSVKYVKITATSAGVVLDKILITTTFLPKLPTPTVGVASSINTTGFTANWTPVANATGYTVTIYQGTTPVGSEDIAGGSSSSLTITGLTTNTTYTYTVIAKGDNVVWRNSNESAKSTAFRTISSLKAITTFTLLGATGTINEGAKTIAVAVPFSSVIPGSYTPTVTVSDYASNLTAGAQTFNLTTPTTPFTIQAEDGSTVVYNVTVTKAPPSNACDITAFSLGVPLEDVSLNQASKTITIVVAGSDNITSITPSITKSLGSTITSPVFPTNFNVPVVIRVTAEAGNFQNYTVTVTKDATPPVYVTSNPTNGQTDFSLAGVFTLTYNENLIDGPGAVTISGGGTLGTQTISGKTVSISFSGLSSLTPYTLSIAANAFKDVYGNAVAAKTINFTTADAVFKFTATTTYYASHMDGSTFALPAFITGGTYDATADSKASTHTQYGAYVLAPAQTLTITTNRIGTILANIYAPGENRTFEVSDDKSLLPPTTGSTTNYENKGTSIQRTINSNAVTAITIKNTSGAGNIYVPYIYLSDLNQPTVDEKTQWCK